MDAEPLHLTAMPVASHTRISETLDDEEGTPFAGGKLPNTESYYRHVLRDDDGRTAPSVVNKSGSTDFAEAELTSMVSSALHVDTKACHRAGIFGDEHGSGKTTRISPSHNMPQEGHFSSDQSEREHLANDPKPPLGKFASDRSSFLPYRNDDCHTYAITPVSTWDGSLTCPVPAIPSQQPDTPSIYPPVHHRGEEDENEDEELARIHQSSPAPPAGVGASLVTSSSARPSGRRNPAIPTDENAVFCGRKHPLSSPSSSKAGMSRRDPSSQFWGPAGRIGARRRSSSSSKGRGILLDATNMRPREVEPVGTPREKEDVRSPTSIAARGGTTPGGAAGRRKGFF